MLFASTTIVFICVVFYETTPLAFLLLIPATVVVFIVSLMIGHFLTEPLRLLCRNVSTFVQGGQRIPFTSKGQFHEADCLAKHFEELADMAKVQQDNLVLKESRQAAFISDVAHELRTPLTAIHGNAEMLLDPDLPPDLHDKFCEIIIDESERLGRLSNDLLTLQHIERSAMPSELQRVNLHNLSREVIDTLSPMLNKQNAHIELVGESPDVLGDPDRLKQVLSNLVENATRFIEPGGHITIELFGLRGNSILTVKDDGPGFGDADPKLLFDRFYRTDSSRSRETGGSGLGLSIVKSIVEAHDGSVEAVNLPDGGACFIVAIPSIAGS